MLSCSFSLDHDYPDWINLISAPYQIDGEFSIYQDGNLFLYEPGTPLIELALALYKWMQDEQQAIRKDLVFFPDSYESRIFEVKWIAADKCYLQSCDNPNTSTIAASYPEIQSCFIIFIRELNEVLIQEVKLSLKDIFSRYYPNNTFIF